MSLESILVMGAIIMAGGSASLLMVRLQNPRLVGLGWFGAALGVGGTGAMLLATDGRQFPLLAILLADLLVLAAFVLLNLAVMEVVGIRGVPAFSLQLLAAQAAADLFHLYGPGSGHFRVTVVGLLIALQTGQTIHLLFRRAAPAIRSPARCIGILLLGFLAWNLLRSLAIATGVLRNRSFAGQTLSSQVQVCTYVIYIVVALGLAFGFFWMTTAGLTAKVEELADTDPLTNALNRRAFSRYFEEELHRAQRSSSSLALLLVDLDHFKQINDRYGHMAGDEVLCAAVHNMKNATRGIDRIGRWGGEEFVVLVPQANADTVQIVAERIRSTIGRPTPFRKFSRRISVTASVGVAIGHGGDSMEDLVRCADEALYRAKSEGRNCIRIAPSAAKEASQTELVLQPACQSEG